MKPKEYNSKSWHAILYKSSYGRDIRYSHEKEGYVDDMPDNICEYGKKLMLAIILFILAWPGHLNNFLTKTYEVKAIWSPLHLPLASLLGMAFFGGPDGHKEFHFWSQYGLGLLCIIGIIMIFIIMLGIMKLCDNIKLFKRKSKEYKEPKVKTPNPIVEWYKAMKGKYCAAINWK